MSQAAMERDRVMEKKIVSISTKRQITIPQKFFAALDFGTEAEFVLRGKELVLRPVKELSAGEFAEQILAELIAEGYSGAELLTKFKETQRKVRPAIEAMLAQAEDAASGKGKYETYGDVFGSEET
jgi:bifunctional DNA-binding transcriptional regulator/antitoxin component of YhaV-PrlF toxin-antitoxin module